MATRNIILAGLFAALLAIGSQVSLILPLSPVPHTLQIFFVLLAGYVLGGRWGFTSVAVWALLGCFGLPVFAQGKAGVIEIVGPTGGYKIGFMICAFVVGKLAEQSSGFFKTVAAMFLGLAIVYIIGYFGFMAHFYYFQHKSITWQQGLVLAVLPYFPYDLIKTFFAAFIGVKIRRALKLAGLLPGR